MSETKTKSAMSMEEFLSEPDVEYLRVPGFNPKRSICIGSLSAGDMIEWTEANEGDAKRTAGLRLIVKSMVDGIPGEDEGAVGMRIGQVTDIAKLRLKSHKVCDRIVDEILKLNGIKVRGRGADDAKKD